MSYEISVKLPKNSPIKLEKKKKKNGIRLKSCLRNTYSVISTQLDSVSILNPGKIHCETRKSLQSVHLD